MRFIKTKSSTFNKVINPHPHITKHGGSHFVFKKDLFLLLTYTIDQL